MNQVLRIAVLDDEISISDNMCEFLSSNGYECEPFVKPIDLVNSLSNGTSFDIIFTDLKMPEMDGLEFIKKVKALGRIVLPKFVLMSGHIGKDQMNSFYDFGADEVVCKPFDLDDIIIIINLLSQSGAEVNENKNTFLNVAIDDFIHTSENKYDVFIKVNNKIICLAQKGQALTIIRLEQLKKRAVESIYLKKDDYMKYVDMQFALTEVAQKSKLSEAKKSQLIKNLIDCVSKSALLCANPTKNINRALAFFEANAVGMVQNQKIFDILNKIKSENSDLLEKNSLLAILSSAVVQTWGWTSPKIQSRIIVSALLCDIGMKELPHLYHKKRFEFSAEDLKDYESHPMRSCKILESIPGIAEEIIEVARQHHENDAGRGFPLKISKKGLHPFSRVVIVVAEFLEKYGAPGQNTDIEKILSDLLKQKNFFSPQTIKGLYLVLDVQLPIELAKLEMPDKTTFLM
jgi:response regulator RpfG family c-di-GMP phosphodiesterase